MVLENGYLRVTLLPKYGGRILSIVHKPTNQELLYQNPIGTPYLMGEGIFYYDYLVIMGGIFPSFPDGEHGRYWNQPYDLTVVSESKEAITVRMSRRDDLGLVSGVPAMYDIGRTDLLVELDVTLRAGSTSVELGTKLTNTRSQAIPKLEFWTVTTLAPGSAPGSTAIPLNTRILAAMDKVHLLESSWSWFGSAEERVSGEIFKWKNLASFKNWVDQGTAFANPDYRANWSGLLNEDKGRGVVRVSDNAKTPGLKLWTFGPQSLSININDSTQWLRPTIEMWHGITPEFWMRGTMAANEVRQWNQSFFPMLGLTGDHGRQRKRRPPAVEREVGIEHRAQRGGDADAPQSDRQGGLAPQRHRRRRARRGDCRRGADHRERNGAEQPGARRRRLRGRFPAERPKPAGWTGDPSMTAPILERESLR